jgi:hypothetical protein
MSYPQVGTDKNQKRNFSSRLRAPYAIETILQG